MIVDCLLGVGTPDTDNDPLFLTMFFFCDVVLTINSKLYREFVSYNGDVTILSRHLMKSFHLSIQL